MKKIIISLILVCLLFGGYFLFSLGESESKADDEQTQQTELMMLEAHRQTGMPYIVNYQQKKLMKMIYELCDKEDLICYAYMFSDYQGKLIYVGKCIGFGLPFSAQYSNPEKYMDDPNGNWDVGSLKLPQPEPNGLFMPTSSSATWLIMIDPETNEPRPVYFEPTIVVSPFKLK
jgi:hypothetical protein